MNDAEAPRPASPTLIWRVAGAADEAYVLDLTFVTMREYLAAAHGWDDDYIRPWLRNRNRVVASQWLIASLEGRDVGVLACGRSEKGIHLQSVHVSPQEQGRGIGTAMIRRVIDWADQLHLPIGLEVMKENPAARRLYERLGFSVFREDARFHYLWRAPIS